MNFLKRLYTLYGLVVFSLLFILLFGFLLIPIVFRSQYRLTGTLNRWWARLTFLLLALPVRITYQVRLDPRRQYIFCPNHFSYLDIPTVGLNRHNTIFVGKNDMEKIPLFGFMYRKLHITVDRSRLKSRYSTMLNTFRALDEGKSLVIFPEGGIVTQREPVMGRFKDGAFRASIEKQIPIVPVTIPYNWIILPADQFLVTWRPLSIVFHKPIDPSGFSLNDIDTYKNVVRQEIEAELTKHLGSPHGNKPDTARQDRAPGAPGVR